MMAPDSSGQICGETTSNLQSDAAASPWLDAVLRETLMGRDEAGNRAALDALLELRKRRAGELFDLVPIGEEMVVAVLTAQYGPGSWEKIAGHLIETLGGDPQCRPRLESLWDRLAAGISEK